MKKPTSKQLHSFHHGLEETKTLMDILSIDFHILFGALMPEFKVPIIDKKLGFVTKIKNVSTSLYEQFGMDIYHNLCNHKSDIMRSFACYLLANHDISLDEKFDFIKPLADDKHSGVREWAWLALRPEIAKHYLRAIEILKPWTHNPSERIRRYASEATRPRGVWCQHIRELRQEPWLAIDILEPLKNDPAKYVQLSVANWLNDAGKDHPEWVINLCRKWQDESDTPNTKKICKRAQRNLITID